MELIITIVCVTMLVISVCNLIGLKAKVTAIATIAIDIIAIVVIVFTVDLTPFYQSVEGLTRKLGELFVGEK